MQDSRLDALCDPLCDPFLDLAFPFLALFLLPAFAFLLYAEGARLFCASF